MSLNLNLNGVVRADGTGNIIFSGTSDLFGPVNITINGYQNIGSTESQLTGTVTDGPGGGGIPPFYNRIMGVTPGFADNDFDSMEGMPGLPGLRGIDGTIGRDGVSGLPGLIGEIGDDGLDGLMGVTGNAGTIGATGLQGVPGFLGLDGNDGEQGFSGICGPKGPTGVQGIAGFPGLEGEDGDFGIPGPVGVQGLNGGAQLLYSNTTIPAGNTVASTAVETAFSSSYTIPANSLIAGDTIDVWLRGVYSTAITPPTGRIKLKIGSTVVADTGTLSALVNVTNAPFWAHFQIIVQSIGVSGVFECQADVEFETTATAALTVGIGNTATFTIDTTATQAITSTFTWGTSSASNTITLREMMVIRRSITPISGISGYPSVTANPASWPNNSPVWRSDLDLLIYYDGTRWLTAQEYSLAVIHQGTQPAVNSSDFVLRCDVPTDYQMYLTRLGCVTFVQTTSSGTQYWTTTFASIDSTNAVISTITTVSTQSDTVATWTSKDIALNVVVSASAKSLRFTPTKVSTPGVLIFVPQALYRKIIT